MDEWKLYSVSDRYIHYLRSLFPNVYSNKDKTRLHTRKYIGTVIQMAEFCYYIPLSSPKPSDYRQAGDRKVIKKSIVPIIRIIVKNARGEKELKGTLRISHMIPVPPSELERYDVDAETDSAYKNLILSELYFIRKNRSKILANARLMYKQKTENDQSAGYVKAALDFTALEKCCMDYMQDHPSLSFSDDSHPVSP